MTRIFLALIHNNETLRLNYLRQKLQEIQTQLSDAEAEICLIEVGNLETPKFSEISFLRRRFENETYSLRKRARARVSYIERFVSMCRFTSTHLRVFTREILRAAKYRERSPLSLFGQVKIEDVVSRKHIETLDKFLDSESDYLVVFESDSVIQYLEQLCAQIIKSASYSNSYEISLFNSHFTLDELGISPRNVAKKERIYQSKETTSEIHAYSVLHLHTNTLCCYGIPRQLALALKPKLELIEKRPLPPADWMFDQAFDLVYEENKTSKIEFRSTFFYPPLVDNGSLLGTYISGIR